MDFGVVSHKQAFPNAVCMGSAELRDERGHGSVNLKHQRSGLVEDCWKSRKMLKPGEVDFSSKIVSDSLASFGRSNLWPPDYGGQKMLSFSSPAPHGGGGLGDGGRSIAFSMDESNSGNGGSGLSGGIRGSFSRLRGPFTPSQWMELEHQALIYKHIVANVPVPSNLLVPLKRSLYSYGSPYASNLWWGPFHLGFSGNNDPEPGRCRRTDGKKWRCSRDAVPDQKYCERHINRGRHRSRKPVEGQTGHASKVASVAHSGSNASNSLSSIQHPLQPNAATASTDHFVSRSQGFQGLSLIPPTTNHKSKDAPFQESSNSGFGIVSSDCLLNPSGKISYMNATSSDSFNTKGANTQHSVHHFIDDWPKGQSDRPSPSWPEELKSDWTQLSMSIPDFSSSSNSPPLEKSTLSTLSLGVSGQPVEKQPSWAPVVWGNSMGGPLGEVLTSTSSPLLGSSPTGVLQKSTLSNSSSGGSLTCGDSKKVAESVSLCNDLLGSALVRSATIPSL